MGHTKFKLFRVHEDNVPDDTTLSGFLNSGIIPHSLSVDNYYQEDKIILIGYEEAPEVDTEHDLMGQIEGPSQENYYLSESSIYDVAFHGMSNIGELVEKEANYQSGAVICQDIQYLGEEALVTFLIKK